MILTMYRTCMVYKQTFWRYFLTRITYKNYEIFYARKLKRLSLIVWKYASYFNKIS